MRDYKSLLSNKNFTLIWTSQIFSQLSINILNFLLLVRLFESTGSTIATAMFWVAYAIPAMIVGPFASATIDIVNRKRVLMYSNLFQSLVILMYAFFYEDRTFLPYGVAMAYSILNQFYVPAEASSLPSLVKKPQLAYANSLFFLTQQASLIIGFGIAGFMRASMGFSNSLIICSLMLMFAFLAVSILPDMKSMEGVSKNINTAFVSYIEKILEGYNFIIKNSRILAPLLILLTLHVSMVIIAVSTPAAAEEVFHTQAILSGITLIVPVGFGALIGAILVPRFLKSGIRKKYLMESAMLSAAILLFTSALLIPHVIGKQRLVFGIISIVLMGFSFVAILIPAQTFVQEATPNHLRGRVFGNFWFLSTVASVIPVIFFGAFSEFFGVRALVTIMGFVIISMFIFSKKYGERAVQNKPLFGRKYI